MKRLAALFLAFTLAFTSVDYTFADVNVNSNEALNVITQENLQTSNLITYLSIANPSISSTDTLQIVVGIDDTDDKFAESDDAASTLTVENTDTGATYEISGVFTDEGNLFFEKTGLSKGCYTVKCLAYSFLNGASVSSEQEKSFSEDGIIYLADIGIDAQFGVDTVVEDANPDAYAIDTASDDTINDAIAETDIDANSNDISEIISDAVDGAIQYYNIDDSENDSTDTDDTSYTTDTTNPTEITKTDESGISIYSASSTALFGASPSNTVTVVLDPGHGGSDGGASHSWNGKTYKESDLNLKIAQYCKSKLEEYSNVNVYMTRTSDTYVGLEDRVNYAKSVGATVFVSIHNNSSNSSSLHGATVYYPNSNYNASVGSQGGALASSVLTQLVALGLANNGTQIRNSENGSKYPDGSLCDYYSVIRNSKKAGFPGIIVEHAFISNQSDATNYLNSDSALLKLGNADAVGIANYFGLSEKNNGVEYNGVNYQLVFDAAYYLENNPDVKAVYGNSKKGALEHFVTFGMSEGRQGRAEFDVSFYKNNNSDLQSAYGSDLKSYYMHYLNYGAAAGRQPTEDIDVFSYKYRYSDLQSAYGNDYKAYINHYITYGKGEGRDATPIKRTVTFVSDGGVVSTVSVNHGRSVTAPSISKEGYSLIWDKSLDNITEDTTITAIWIQDAVNVSYQAHVANVGWQNSVSNGKLAGTTGKSRAIEAVKIDLDTDKNLEVVYRTHVQNDGWHDNSYNGEISGTTGQSKRVEAVNIDLVGDDADDYDIYYRVHVSNIGWLAWAKNGQAAGTSGQSRAIEAIQIVVVDKDSEVPSNSLGGYTTVNSNRYISSSNDNPTINTNTSISYQTHVKDIGWQGAVSNGTVAGTTGKGLRVEALKISLSNRKYSGGISYSVHVQNVGWQTAVSDGTIAGTTGQALQVEALKINLTGEMAKHNDVYYRVHVQDIGWMDWVKDGEIAGTIGKSLRVEALQVKLVEKV